MGGSDSTTLVCNVARDKVDNWVCTSSAHIILEPTAVPDDKFLLEVDKPDPDPGLSKRDKPPVPRRSTIKGPFDGTESTVVDFAPIHQLTRYRFVHVRGKGGQRCVLARNLSSNDVTNPAPRSPQSTRGATRKNFKPPQKPPEPKDASLLASAATYWEVEQQHPARTRTPDGKRDAAYQTAFAIMSPAVTFVEWTLFENYLDHPWYQDITDPGKWLPFEFGNQRAKNWQEIHGERWIYVFRAEQVAGKARIPTCVDELFLDKDGNLHGTITERHVRPDGTVDWPERGVRGAGNARGASKPIGRSISLVRQLVDKVFEYWFVATHFQLPAKALNDLNRLPSKVWLWAPAITLSPDDPLFFDGKVPVLDPITIAQALHDRYDDACNDYTAYIAPVGTSESASKQEAAERQQKVALAELINAMVHASPVGLIGHLKPGEPTQFLNDYSDQTGYREAWRDYWCMQLTKWLQSDAITAIDQIVGRDLRPFDPKYEDFGVFFKQMSDCRTGLLKSPFGQGLLDMEVRHQEKFMWLALAMQEHPTAQLVEVLRKEGSAVLETLFEHAHHMIVHLKKDFAREVLSKALARYFIAEEGKPILIIVGNETRGWWQGGPKGPKLVGTDKIEAARWELQKEFENSELAAAKAKSGTKQARLMSGILLIELLNFLFVIHEFDEVWQRDKKVASLQLTDAALELVRASTAIPAVKEALGQQGAKTAARVLGTLAALVEVVLFTYETYEAWHEGKIRKAVGSGVSAAGAATIVTGLLLGSEVVPIVGMVVVGIGVIVQMAFKDPNDYENLLTFSYFGKQDGSAHEPDWYEPAKSFAEWRDDIEEQLQAALSLLCKLEIQPAISVTPANNPLPYGAPERMRTATVQCGWIPGNATLNCHYHVDWRDPTESADIKASIRFKDDGKLAVSPSHLVVALDDKGNVLVEGPDTNIADVDQGGYYINPRLKAITVTCYLEVPLAGTKFIIWGRALKYGGTRTKKVAAVLYGDEE
jgi:hypothetical protein